MKLNSFEINLIVDYYESEIARLQNRLDVIRYNVNEYDRDLQVTQIDRIRNQIRGFERRKKELQNPEGEID